MPPSTPRHAGNNALRLALLFAVSLMVCPCSQASLIGDTITIQRQSPLGTVATTTDVLVQAGTGDQFAWLSNVALNPEASSLNLTSTLVGLNTHLLLGPNFHGLVVSGIADTITGVSISTNLGGWDDSRLSFGEHSLNANFADLTWRAGTTFNATLTLVSANVPDTGSTLSLSIVTVLGLLAAARRSGMAT